MKVLCCRPVIPLLILSCAASACAGKEPAVMPVTSFIIELKDKPEKIFYETVTTYRITYPDTEFELPRTVNQMPLTHTKDKFTTTAIITCGARNAPVKMNPRQYTSPTLYLDSGNPEIIKKALELKGGNDIVMNISRFVYDHISSKKTGIPMLPASVILKNRTGDCTEHSVLTAALLRAAGIPARCIVGVILCDEFMGKNNVFVYHMWVEAYYSGRWILVDSTRPCDIHINRYIAFTCHPLTTETPMSYIAALSALTDITITRIER